MRERARMYPALVELVRTRLLEVVREPEALFWMFFFPVIMAVALGIAFPSRSTDTVIVGVVNRPGSDAAASALRGVTGVQARLIAPGEIETALRRSIVQMILEPGAPPTYRYDPTRAECRLARRVVDDALQRAAGRRDRWTPAEQTIVTPGARYVDWLVPGLLGMTIMSTSLWGVGFSIVQARTRKLLKRLIATPMRRRDYLIGQALARLVFLTLEAGILLAAGRLLFGVPIRGGWAAIASISVLGALAFAALALLAASRARTVEGLSGLLNVLILPMWIVSGVFFASSNFPDAFQPVIQALPLTALNNALRAVMLEGAPLRSQAEPIAILGAWGVGSFVLALRLFRWR
jgi:ABC-type polysaccharide/polyol phosphate export permease